MTLTCPLTCSSLRFCGSRIESGELPPRRAVPSSARSTRTVPSGRVGTIDKAMAILNSEGLVRTAAGRYIFATERQR